MAEETSKGDASHGRHWNIFLIIMTVMIFSVFIPNFLIPFSYLIGFGVSFLFQLLLCTDFESYLLSWKEHDNFFHENAIGIFQTIGYFSCYLIGLGFGRRLYKIAHEDRKDEDRIILLEILIMLVVCLLIFFLSYFLFKPTAPAVCNLAYVSYVLLMGYFTFLVALLPDRMIPKLATNILYEGPGKTSRLIYFTLANIFTGIINILFELEEHGYAFQICVIIVYLLILHMIFALLISFKVNVRFW